MERTYKFTLIELFVTLFLMSMAGSIFLVQIKPMRDRYYFDQGVAKLKRELLFSKNLAEATHGDIEFHIIETKKGLECERKTDEPLNLPKTINTLIKIPSLHLEDDMQKFTIIFTSSGSLQGTENFTVSNSKSQKIIECMSLGH